MIKEKRTAMILCGGKGTRLGALGNRIPKTLVKIHKKEILWFMINFLKKNNFNHIILPLGYRGNQIRNFINKNKNFDLSIDQVNTGENTKIGLRILKVLKRISSSDVLIINGDSILNFDLNKIFIKHVRNKYDVTFLSNENQYQFGTVCLQGSKIVDFKRNIIFDSVNVRKKKNYIAYNYAGIIIIKTKKLLKHSKIFKKSDNFEKDFYPILIKRYKSNLVKIDGFFHSVDNMKDIYIANHKFSKNIFKNISTIKKKYIKNF